jgi:hypothetical protein
VFAIILGLPLEVEVIIASSSKNQLGYESSKSCHLFIKDGKSTILSYYTL